MRLSRKNVGNKMLTMMVVHKPPTSFDEGLAKESNMNGHIGKLKNDTNDVKSANTSAIRR